MALCCLLSSGQRGYSHPSLFIVSVLCTLRFEHTGSAAVPDISETVAIDIAIGIPSGVDGKDVTETLQRIGYVRYPDEGPTYRKVVEPHDREYHLFLVPLGRRQWQDLLRFRDILRNHPEIAKAYSDLKEQLAGRQRVNPAYYRGKKDFVEQVLQETQKENE